MQFLKKLGLVVGIAAMSLGLQSAGAATIGVFNTGQGIADNSVDPNYTITLNPDGTGAGAIVQDSSVFPISDSTWQPDTATSRWIGPRFNTSGSAGGAYAYTTTFTLPADADLSTATLSGLWAFDDGGGVGGITLNGNPISGPSAGFKPQAAFSTSTGFVIGLNTLVFSGTNGGGFTGLKVDNIAGTYSVTPEPGSLALVGVCGIFGLLRRRCSSVIAK